jgi:hypothetical protein
MGISFLKKVADTLPSRSLKYLLHAHLNGPEDGRPFAVIHASELTKPDELCPRVYALADVTKTKPKGQWLTTSEQVMYRMGRDQQDAVVNWFADMGRAVGHWKCIACNHLHEFQKRPQKCVACNSRAFQPKEVRFTSAINGASCGIDMLVALGDTKLVPVEIKTMAAEQFKGLLAPLAEHRLRTNLYLRIIKESAHSWSNQVDTNKAIVLYIQKGGYGCADTQLKAWGLKEQFSPFKDYEIKRIDSETDVLAARAKVVTDFRADKIGMPTGLCTTAMSKRAISCQFKTICFAGDHPPTHDWKVTNK